MPEEVGRALGGRACCEAQGDPSRRKKEIGKELTCEGAEVKTSFGEWV